MQVSRQVTKVASAGSNTLYIELGRLQKVRITFIEGFNEARPFYVCILGTDVDGFFQDLKGGYQTPGGFGIIWQGSFECESSRIFASFYAEANDVLKLRATFEVLE